MFHWVEPPSHVLVLPNFGCPSAGVRGRGFNRTRADVPKYSLMARRWALGRKSGTVAESSDFGVREIRGGVFAA